MKKLERRLLEYYKKEFLNSDFYDEDKNLEKQLNGRENKDFFVQKEKDYENFHEFLLDSTFANGIDFGRILEISKGPSDCVAIFDEEKMFDFFVLSQHGTYEVFGKQDFEVKQGMLDFIEMKTEIDYDLVKAYIRYFEKNLNGNKFPSFKNFDSVINLCDTNYDVLYNTYVSSIEENKFVIIGSVSNIYDKTLECKINSLEYIYDFILQSDENAKIEYIENKGSVLQLIHNV